MKMLLQTFADRRRTSRASDYAARVMSGELTAREEEEIRSWCAEHEDNRVKLNQALDSFARTGLLVDDRELLALAHEPTNRPDTPQWRQPMVLTAVAALVLLLVGGGFFIRQVLPPSVNGRPVLYSTAIGEQRTVRLPDGTVLSLNTDSQVIVDFQGRRRRTILERGEVFFDVAHDASRPFVVELGSRAITVLGTKFNVRKVFGGELAVAVVDGVVAVHRSEDSASPAAPVLRASGGSGPSVEVPDQFRLEKGSVVTLRERDYKTSIATPPDIESVEDWRHGFVRFDAASLASVARELNRYSTRKIIIEDASIMELQVNAVVNFERLDIALDGLERVLPIRVTRFEDRVTISARPVEDTGG